MTKAQKTEEIDTSSSPYTIPVDEEVKVYHLHPPFSSSRISRDDSYQTVSLGDATNKKFVSYETNLGRSQGMATCPSCKQQVLTNVTYKIGVFAWLMCLVFILCGGWLLLDSLLCQALQRCLSLLPKMLSDSPC
ncbi:uncharacterized protein LOC108926694 isoform X2 [Scleropages formosus]|uniref:uncharacterized protein LOC108926694 isoform X2 n=1 Tax=Scleropages formosus TaxID=113540 RepID=UPI0008780B19|nr:uncharacterized protein LOC108926694 isoform X2 [Scleropages formosus]